MLNLLTKQNNTAVSSYRNSNNIVNIVDINNNNNNNKNSTGKK